MPTKTNDPAFFQPDTIYVRAEPRIPELLQVFDCRQVVEHPRTGQLCAFGFVATVAPGNNWTAVSRTTDDWADGWIVQVPDA